MSVRLLAIFWTDVLGLTGALPGGKTQHINTETAHPECHAWNYFLLFTCMHTNFFKDALCPSCPKGRQFLSLFSARENCKSSRLSNKLIFSYTNGESTNSNNLSFKVNTTNKRNKQELFHSQQTINCIFFSVDILDRIVSAVRNSYFSPQWKTGQIKGFSCLYFERGERLERKTQLNWNRCWLFQLQSGHPWRNQPFLTSFHSSGTCKSISDIPE